MTKPPITLPKPWPDFLREVDHELTRAVNLHCLGGFVLAALYGLPRPTGDLDYIEVVPRDAGQDVEKAGGRYSAPARRYRLFLQRVGVADLPDEYESRLSELGLNLRNLRLWALDPYDLLLSKVGRNGPKDREDAKFLIQKLKLEFSSFQSRWEDEMAPWIPNRDRNALTIKLWAEYFPK